MRSRIRRPGLTHRAFSVLACLVLAAACGDGGGSEEPLPAPTTISSVDRIAYAQEGVLYTINADGSDRTLLAEGAQMPVWSPEGDRIAFLSGPSAIAEGRARGAPYLDLHVIDAGGSRRIDLTAGATGPGGILGFSWSPDGTRIAFAAGGAIYIARADGSQLLQLASGLGDLGSAATASHSVAWSPDGKVIAFTNGHVNLIDAAGSTPRQVGEGCGDAVAFSPDSKQLAVACNRTSLHVINIDGTGATELTRGIEGFDRLQSFQWSPDGSRIAFDTQRPRELWVAAADGSSLVTLPQGRTPSWSADGNHLAFACPDIGWQLCVVSGNGSSRRLVSDASHGSIDSLSVAYSPARQ